MALESGSVFQVITSLKYLKSLKENNRLLLHRALTLIPSWIETLHSNHKGKLSVIGTKCAFFTDFQSQGVNSISIYNNKSHTFC